MTSLFSSTSLHWKSLLKAGVDTMVRITEAITVDMATIVTHITVAITVATGIKTRKSSDENFS